ncbi:hypothetical protein [Sinorhizobium meliloti]|nr:hypothetical protein [Sinorhizobium meliloti]
MKPRSLRARRIGVLLFSLCAFGLMAAGSVSAEGKLVVETVVEKR